MSEKPFLIISDLHLGAVPESTERAFWDFLAHAATESSGLLINGDLFDVWVTYRSVVPRRHVRTLARLTDVVETGVPVYFVGGNHDAVEWGGEVLRDDVGMVLLQDPIEMDLAGRRALITHGDMVDKSDRGYRLLRSVLRNRAFISVARGLHPDWLHRMAGGASVTGNKVNRAASGHAGFKRHAGPIEAWAREELRAKPHLDLIVAGHAHVPVNLEVEPGRYYLNAGDWIEHFTYIALPPEQGSPQLLRWDIPPQKPFVRTS
jgi:UDP-2,3-diacylglucosamine hydrolase